MLMKNWPLDIIFRREHGVEVDMRIGIHTGYILSGVIGLRKWQYDIWYENIVEICKTF